MDEGAGTVQVCMHLGGMGLVDRITLSTLDGSARGKFNVVIILLINNPDLNCCCSGKGLLKSSADFSSELWRKEVHNYWNPK